MFCENCGKEIAEDMNFCAKCGTRKVEKRNVNSAIEEIRENELDSSVETLNSLDDIKEQEKIIENSKATLKELALMTEPGKFFIDPESSPYFEIKNLMKLLSDSHSSRCSLAFCL